MIGDMLLLVSYGFNEGQFGVLLDRLTQMGFFSYVLPFLLIFALIYGILLRVKIFEKNSINGIIALAVGLMALQFDFVPIFFSELFPRVGIGLAIILAILILVGLFLPDKPWVGYTLFGISAIIVLVILIQSGGAYGSPALYWFYDNWPLIFGLIFIIVFMIIITKDKDPKPPLTLGEVLPHFRYEP